MPMLSCRSATASSTEAGPSSGCKSRSSRRLKTSMSSSSGATSFGGGKATWAVRVAAAAPWSSLSCTRARRIVREGGGRGASHLEISQVTTARNPRSRGAALNRTWASISCGQKSEFLEDGPGNGFSTGGGAISRYLRIRQLGIRDLVGRH
jgi:hypothetical protein